MLNFLSLGGTNIGPYEKFEIPLDHQGLVFIQGSNGAGKSFLWEILAALLFTQSSRGLRKDDFVRSSDCFAYVNFRHDDGPIWTICLYRNHATSVFKKTKFSGNGYLIFRDDQDVTPRGGIPAAEKFIAQCVGISEADFYSFVYMSQNFQHVLLRGTGTERFAWVSSMFGLEEFDRIQVAISEALNQSQQALAEYREGQIRVEDLSEQISRLPSAQTLEEQRLLLQSQVTQYQQSIPTVQNNISVLQNQISALESYENQKLRLDHLLTKYNLSRQGLQSYRVQLIDHCLTLSTQEGYLQNEYQHLQQRQEQYNKRLDLMERLVNFGVTMETPLQTLRSYYNEQIPLLKERMRLAQHQKEQFDWYSRLIAQITEQSNPPWPQDLTEQLENTKKYYGELEMQRVQLQHSRQQLTQIIDTNICPLCNTPIDPQQKKAELANLQVAQQNNNLALQETLALLNQLSAHEERRSKVRQLQAQMPDRVPEMPEDVGQLTAQLANYEDIRYLLSQYEMVAEAEPPIPAQDLEKRLEEIRSTKEITTLQRDQVTEACNEEYTLTFCEKDLPDRPKDVLQAELAQNNAYYQQASLSVSEISQRLGVVQQQLDQYANLNNQLMELSQNLSFFEQHEQEHQDLLVLKQAFSNKGLKLIRVSQIAQAITQTLNVHTPSLFGDPTFRFVLPTSDTSLDILVERTYRTYDARTLSGGEARRANIGLILAVLNLVPVSRRTNLIILDEFDCNVDTKGVHLFATELLPYLKKHLPNQSIMFISHHENFQSVDALDQTWFVSHNNGVSSIEFRRNQ